MKNYFLLLITMFCMFSCSSDDDFIEEKKPQPEETPTDDRYQVVQWHTEGMGFPVVIMADGYAADDTYANAVTAAKNALFVKEPMKSLEKYFDIISVTVASNHVGIDTKKHDTAFRTSISAGNDTNVFGDSIAVMNYTIKALKQVYKLNDQEVSQRIVNTLAIVLLNSNAYKGVTILYIDPNAGNKESSGFALSYVPSDATINGQDVFSDLIQHEAVGHGIAKLGDEYQSGGGNITTSVVNSFKEGQRIGFFLNIRYDETARTTGGSHDIGEDTPELYQLSVHPDYANEDVKWYTGAYTYPTCFCRTSMTGIMNATTMKENRESFNAVSRMFIYKRVMRVAKGEAWSFNLNEFSEFDAPARNVGISVGAKAVSPFMNYVDGSAPMLLAPKIVKMNDILH